MVFIVFAPLAASNSKRVSQGEAMATQDSCKECAVRFAVVTEINTVTVRVTCGARSANLYVCI